MEQEIISCLKKNRDCSRALFLIKANQHKLNINYQDENDGWTIFECACHLILVEIIKLMLSLTFNPPLDVNLGINYRTPFYCVLINFYSDTACILARDPRVYVNSSWMTIKDDECIKFAARQCMCDVIKTIIASGRPIYDIDSVLSEIRYYGVVHNPKNILRAFKNDPHQTRTQMRAELNMFNECDSANVFSIVCLLDNKIYSIVAYIHFFFTQQWNEKFCWILTRHSVIENQIISLCARLINEDGKSSEMRCLMKHCGSYQSKEK